MSTRGKSEFTRDGGVLRFQAVATITKEHMEKFKAAGVVTKADIVSFLSDHILPSAGEVEDAIEDVMGGNFEDLNDEFQAGLEAAEDQKVEAAYKDLQQKKAQAQQGK